ncbi:MAG TPA: PKD domain-containing protein, partial [Patescibacteria group bacterium]|nr:PKD domain-containing protein [Patescibacteria group bacterium]
MRFVFSTYISRSFIASTILSMVFFACLSRMALAQNTESIPSETPASETVSPAAPTDIPEVKQLPLKARAGKNRNVVVGRTVLFDASASTAPENITLQYQWDFGDGSSAEGIDTTHIYTNSGNYKVTLTVKAIQEESGAKSEDTIMVSVQDQLVLLIADQSVSEKQIQDIQTLGLTQGTLVIPIQDIGVDQEYLSVQNLAQQMLEKMEDVSASDVIITMTSANVGLNSLIELARISTLSNTSFERFHLNNKAIVAINNQSLISSVKIAQTAFQTLQPKYIIVSDSKILDDVVRTATPEELEKALPQTDAKYQMITEYSFRGLQDLGIFNFMSYAMNYMINRGVPTNSLFLLLMLPVMATIIAAARQIVGIRAFGIFAPTVIALSFLATGLKYGVVVFFIIIILGTFARILMK